MVARAPPTASGSRCQSSPSRRWCRSTGRSYRCSSMPFNGSGRYLPWKSRVKRVKRSTVRSCTVECCQSANGTRPTSRPPAAANTLSREVMRRPASSLRQAEGRVLVGQQQHVGAYPIGPAVHAHDQLPDVLAILAGEQQQHRGDQDQRRQQADEENRLETQRGQAGQTNVVRNGEKPLHQRLPAGHVLGVFRLQVSGVVRLSQAEGGILVRGQSPEAVEGHSPGPAQHPQGEVEKGPGILTGEEDGEKGDARDEGRRA